MDTTTPVISRTVNATGRVSTFISMVIPMIIQVIYNQLDSSFIGAGIITIIFGILFFLSNLNHEKKLNLQQAFLLTALSWLSIAIF